MSFNGKVWGSTQLILQTPFIELHKLVIKPNSYCSQHLHQYRWNGFYVTKGRLNIHVVKNDYDLTDVTCLEAGTDHDFTTVKPNEYHWFSTDGVGCECIEIYYPEPLAPDIVRKSVGGTA